MKKLLILAVASCQLLGGCITFYNLPEPSKNEVSAPSHKAIVDFAYKGEDYSKQVEEALSQTSYFNVAENHTNAEYIIFISSASTYSSGAKFFPVLISAFTAYLLPFVDTEKSFTFDSFIVNTKTGEKAELGDITVTRKTYAGIGVLLFGGLFSSGEYMQDGYSENPSKYVPVFKEYIDRAAAQIYDAKSKLHTGGEYLNDESRAAAILAKQEISSQELLFAAANAKDFNLFNQAKSKVKEPIDQCALDLSLITNKSGILSKEMPEYWQLVEAYKKSCVAYRASLKNEIGMSKAQLVDAEGVPSSSYRINEKTETISYRKNMSFDGNIYSKDFIYTLDQDIVTKIMVK